MSDKENKVQLGDGVSDGLKKRGKHRNIRYGQRTH